MPDANPTPLAAVFQSVSKQICAIALINKDRQPQALITVCGHGNVGREALHCCRSGSSRAVAKNPQIV